MAMLAEPRRKQRIGPNPRGKFFLEDDDNKGRTMLQKLGWQNGDGLGRQNQGMSNPLCPKIQMDSKGLGYDVKSDPWVAHSEEFAEVLENLQAIHKIDSNGNVAKAGPDSDEESRARKLEKLSKSSRARIHYHKLVKSKDVSNFSNTDLKCIFGVDDENPSLKTKQKKKRTDDGAASVPLESSGDAVPEKSFDEDGVKTINRGSMADYFKALMAQKMNGVAKADSIDHPPNCTDAAGDDRILKEKKRKKKTKRDDGQCQIVESEPPIESEMAVGEKKKKRRKKEKFVQQEVTGDDENGQGQVVESEPPIESEMVVVEKKKRRKKEKIVQEWPGNDENGKCQVVEPESIASEMEVGQKKKKRKKEKLVQQDATGDGENGQCQLVESEPIPSEIEVGEKKKKRRKKEKLGEQQELTVNDDDVQLNKKNSDAQSQKGTTVESADVDPPKRSAIIEQSFSKKYKISTHELKKIAEQFKGANLHKIPGYGPY